MKNETILLDTNAFSRLMQGDEFVIRSADEAKRIVLRGVRRAGMSVEFHLADDGPRFQGKEGRFPIVE